MTTEAHGAARRRSAGFNATRGYILMAVVALIGAGTWIGLSMRGDAAAGKVHAAAWTVAGPPCPQINAAWYKVLAITPIPFKYESLQGVRAHGDVNCDYIDYDGARRTSSFPICQFTAPFALAVQTPAGVAYFEPGSGQPATLEAPDGRLRCVMGASLTDD